MPTDEYDRRFRGLSSLEDTTITASDEAVVNRKHYLPPSEDQRREVSENTFACPVKSAARYFHVNDACGQVDILARHASFTHLGHSRLQASAQDSVRGPALNARTPCASIESILVK